MNLLQQVPTLVRIALIGASQPFQRGSEVVSYLEVAPSLTGRSVRVRHLDEGSRT